MRLPFFRGSSQLVSVVKDADQGNAVNLGATPLGAGTIQTLDLDVSGYSTLLLYAEIGNASTPATAATDANPYVNLYRTDNTLTKQSMPIGTDTSSLQGNVSVRYRRYDVTGVSRVRLSLLNNNVGALQGGYLDYFLQR